RRETRDMPVYAIVVGKAGPKLTPSTVTEAECAAGSASDKLTSGEDCHTIFGGRGRGLHGKAIDLADVAFYTQNWTDRPIVDKSGLKGLFNIQTLGWVPMDAPNPYSPPAGAGDGNFLDPDRPTVFQIFEKLGLRLDPQRAPVDVVVVESYKPPSG